MQNRLILLIKKVPVLHSIAKTVYRLFVKNTAEFPGSAAYWESRYQTGGNSGSGSYNLLAQFKADVINDFVAENQVNSVAEFGCGDGNQLSLGKYPKYIGMDVSNTAVEICKKKFKNDPTKFFYHLHENELPCKSTHFPVELALSLDVIYHLVEDRVFEQYMHQLFSSSNKFVIIYASDFATEQVFHERDRVFTKWIEKSIVGWQFERKIRNIYPYDSQNQEGTSKADFFIYKKI